MSDGDLFTARIQWTGNRGQGTHAYRGYDRTWSIMTGGKVRVDCSNDPKLGGDPAKHNPEDLLLASLASCHMLWYLHLAAKAGIVVHAYADEPIGYGETSSNGGGRFVSANLRPQIEVAEGADLVRAEAIHHEIHRYCYIARSVSFPVSYEPQFKVVSGS